MVRNAATVDSGAVMCTVFIADDVEALRFLVRMAVEDDPEIRVVGEAQDGAETIDGVAALRPDVLILDLSMPNRDGLAVIEALQITTPGTQIIVLSAFSASRMAATALRLGACEYVEKGQPLELLRDAIHRHCPALR